MVPRERFDGLCRELEETLKREQQAQDLLNTQTRQLEEIEQQLNAQLTEENKNQHTMGEAVQVS